MHSEVDGLRIALVRAQLEKDPHAEHEALLKLTAHVSDPQLLAQLGALEVRFRDFGLAQGDYKKLLASQPQNADAMNQLGYAYGFDGKIPEAEAIYAEYGKLPRQQANAFDSLGEIYFMNGKFGAAEKAFLHAHEIIRPFSPAATCAKPLMPAGLRETFLAPIKYLEPICNSARSGKTTPSSGNTPPGSTPLAARMKPSHDCRKRLFR